MKRNIQLIILALLTLALAGCDTVTFNVLANNQIFNSRGQVAAAGNNDSKNDGGGTVNAEASADLKQ